MFRKTTLIIFSIIAVIIVSAPAVFTNPEQPPAGRTGCDIPPVETTCGVATCHGNLNTGPGSVSITFSDPNLKYAPSQTYDVTVTTNETGKVRFGFEITVVDEAGDPIGTLIIPGGSTTISSPPGGLGGRDYLGHKNASSVNSWTFQWTAPADEAGNIIFYAAGNCANGNNNTTGDNIYTTSLTITPDTGSGIFDAANPDAAFSIKSISGNVLTVEMNPVQAGNTRVNLYDLQGRLVQNLMNEPASPGSQQHTFYLDPDLAHGLYFVEYRTANHQAVERILIGD